MRSDERELGGPVKTSVTSTCSAGSPISPSPRFVFVRFAPRADKIFGEGAGTLAIGLHPDLVDRHLRAGRAYACQRQQKGSGEAIQHK